MHKPTEYFSLELNSQLKILDRLHRADTMAFKLFYSPRSPIYDHIKNSIQGELAVSWDLLVKIADPKKKKTSHSDAESLGEIAEKIDYDLNQLLIQAAMLQDAFAAIEKLPLTQKDAAQTGWISLQAQIMDIRKKILAKVPEQIRIQMEPRPISHEPETTENPLNGQDLDRSGQDRQRDSGADPGTLGTNAPEPHGAHD